MELTFRGHYDQPTMLRALMVANQPSHKALLLQIGILILLGGAFVYTLVVFLQSGGIESFRVLRMFIAFASWIYIISRPYLSARKIAGQFDENGFILHGLIDRRGLRINPGPAERFIEWEKFADWRTADELVVLVLADNNIYPFLKRFFKSDEEWKQFMVLLKDRIQKAK